jgi:hypothetical protein
MWIRNNCKEGQRICRLMFVLPVAHVGVISRICVSRSTQALDDAAHL